MLHIHVPINNNCLYLRVILKPTYKISCVIRTTCTHSLIRTRNKNKNEYKGRAIILLLCFAIVFKLTAFLKQIQEEISHLIQELSTLHSEITNLKNQIVSQSKEISSSRGIYMNMYVNSIYITKAYNECNIMSDFWRGLLVLSFKKVSGRPTSGFCRFQVILRWILKKKTLQYRKNSHFKKRYLKFRYLTEICTCATHISTCTLMRISQELSVLRSLEVT